MGKEETFDKLHRFLDRCITHPEYRICLFANDDSSLCTFKEEMLQSFIDRYIENIISIKHNANEIEIRFDNGSSFRAYAANQSRCGIRANILFVDDKIKESVLKTIIEPCICAYEHDGCKMINPKPIYIKI